MNQDALVYTLCTCRADPGLPIANRRLYSVELSVISQSQRNLII